MPVSARLARKVHAEFATEADAVLEILAEANAELIEKYSNSAVSDRERLIAAAVVVATGRVDELFYAMDLMQKDWRDLLAEAGLGHEDWPSKMVALLGPA